MSLQFGYGNDSENKVGPVFFGDGKGNATKCGVMFYGDGKGNATKIYADLIVNGTNLFSQSNVVVTDSGAISPYRAMAHDFTNISGEVLTSPIQLKYPISRCHTGIQINIINATCVYNVYGENYSNDNFFQAQSLQINKSKEGETVNVQFGLLPYNGSNIVETQSIDFKILGNLLYVHQYSNGQEAYNFPIFASIVSY